MNRGTVEPSPPHTVLLRIIGVSDQDEMEHWIAQNKVSWSFTRTEVRD